MEEKLRPKIVCLSNAFDQHYHDVRGEKVERCLTASFRRELFSCLEMASGRELIVLSVPPEAGMARREMAAGGGDKVCNPPPVVLRQLGRSQLRIPLAWIFYARHVLAMFVPATWW